MLERTTADYKGLDDYDDFRVAVRKEHPWVIAYARGFIEAHAFERPACPRGWVGEMAEAWQKGVETGLDAKRVRL